MPRTATATELARLKAAHYWLALRADIQDADGAWVRLDTLGGLDWVKGADWGASIDEPVQSGTLRLFRERGTDGTESLAPLIEASGYNRNAAGGYAPLLHAGRRLRLYTSVVDPGGDFATEWKEAIQAKVDRVKWPGHVAALEFRDLGAILQDTQIQEARVYGSAAGTAVETVMQEILDDNNTGVTLYTPTSPGWFIHEYQQAADTNVLDALLQLARQIGWEVRYKYDAGDQFRLTFYRPERNPAAPDHTFTADDYLDVTGMDSGDTSVRNQVRLFSQTADGTPLESYREDPASIAEFGPRYMEVPEEKTSNIDTQAELDDLGDIILSDLASPPANQETRNTYFWPVQVADFYRWEPNGYHYDTPQDLAVQGYKHEVEGGTGHTSIQVRGKPAGAYHSWIRGFGGTPRTRLVSVQDVALVWDEAGQVLKLSGTGLGDVRSAVFMVSDSPAFDSPIIQEHLALTDGDTLVREYGAALFTRGETYYGRVVPYTGALDAGTGQVTGLPGQSLLDMEVIPLEAGPFGSIAAHVTSEGAVSFAFSGNANALSFAYKVSKTGYAANSTDATVVDARSGEVSIDPAVLSLGAEERAYITGWFYSAAAGGGDEGPAVRESASRGAQGPPGPEGSTDTDLAIYNFRVVAETETYRDYAWVTGPLVEEVWIYDWLDPIPGPDNPWPGALDDPVAILSPGQSTWRYYFPDGDHVRRGQVEPRMYDEAIGGYIAGPLRRLEMYPPPLETPHFPYLHQVSTPASRASDVYGQVHDPAQSATGTGTLQVWTNPDGTASPDPSGPPDATLVIDAFPFTFGPDTLFDDGSQPLNNIPWRPGTTKTIHLEMTTSDGRTTGREALALEDSLEDLVDEVGELRAGSIKRAEMFAAGIDPILVLAAVPTEHAGSDVIVVDGELYRWNGASYTRAVQAVTLVGEIVADQIAKAAITTAKFAQGIEPVTIHTGTSLPTSKVTETLFWTTDRKLYRWDSGQLKYIATVAAGDVSGQLTAAQLADSAVTTAKLATNAVTAGKLAAGAVGSGHLQDLAVTAAKVAASAITTAKLATAAVTTAKLAEGAATAAVLAANAVTETKIADDAVTTPKLVAGSVVAAKIATGAIQAGHIAAGAIEAGHIAAGAITTAKLDALAVTAAKIAAGAIVADKIAADAVTTVKLAANAITAAKIAAGAVEAGHIAAGAVTTAKLDALAVTAQKIAAGAIETDKLAANAVTAAKIAADTITAGQIAAGAISTTELAANAVTAAKIAAGTITANEIAANTITAGQIAADTITAAQIAAGTITATELAADSITAAKIAAGAVSAEAISSGAVTTVKLSADAVTAEKISVTTLSAISANLGTITAGHLRNAANTAAIRLSGSATLPSTYFLDLTGADAAFLKHPALTLQADGDAVFTKGVIRDINSRFVADLTAAVLEVRDDNGTLRTKLGNLGAGAANYGIQIYNSQGVLILNADGEGMVAPKPRLEFASASASWTGSGTDFTVSWDTSAQVDGSYSVAVDFMRNGAVVASSTYAYDAAPVSRTVSGGSSSHTVSARVSLVDGGNTVDSIQTREMVQAI